MRATKVSENIMFIVQAFTRFFIAYTFGLIIRRNNNYITFFTKVPPNKDLFMHNTKYLYLYLLSNENNFKLNWLCDDDNLRKQLTAKGFKNVNKTYSLKGMYYSLKSKYWFHNFTDVYLNQNIFNYNATIINLWHGSGGIKQNVKPKLSNKILNYFFEKFRVKDSYYCLAGNVDKSNFIETFEIDEKTVKTLGNPRNDVLFKNIPYENVFIERELEEIKQLKKLGKKIVIYMPTFRATGKYILGWLKSEKILTFLKNNQIVIICKLHFKDINAINLERNESIIPFESSVDMQPLLKYSDGLISDYSSVSFDFMLLNKPIIYYVPDLLEFQETCEQFYKNYDEKIAGAKVINEQELISALTDIANNVDKYKKRKEELLKETFTYQDGNSSARIIKFIRSLEK